MRPLRYLLAALLLSGCIGSEGQQIGYEQVPFTASPSVVQSTPEAHLLSDHEYPKYLVAWPYDGRSQIMGIGYEQGPHVELKDDLAGLNRSETVELMAAVKADADYRSDGSGKTDAWNGTVDWVLGSVKSWGTPRRFYCITFRWQPPVRDRMAIGHYCRAGGADADGQAEAMLREVDFRVK